MEIRTLKIINIAGVGEVSYAISSNTHFVENFVVITEYGIVISADKDNILGCTHAGVHNISDDKNLITKTISLLANEQALPIHLEDILENILF